jgi:hypothetical protein
MTKSMTGSFYLTGTVRLPATMTMNNRVATNIDLSSYVNVPTGQAIAIESVDFIHQVTDDFGSNVDSMLTANGAVTTQLTDLNPALAFVRADNHSLVASGAINIDKANCVVTHSADFFPDNFGPSSLSEAFLVVNDTLYLTSGADSSIAGTTVFGDIFISVRIRCRVVKLSTKDWMAIAIQSTASE